MTQKGIMFKIVMRGLSLLGDKILQNDYRWAEHKVEELIDSWGIPPSRESDDESSEAGQMAMNDSQSDPFADDEVTRGREALTVAFFHRTVQYLPILVLIGVLWSNLIHIQEISRVSIGVPVEVLGAIILARGILRKPSELTRLSKTILPNSLRGSPTDLLYQAVETVDGYYGVLLISVGVGIQIL